jgi:microcystin degradation protein MlrC
VLRRILVENARPVTAFQKIPAVVPAERSSTEANSGVAVDLKRQIQQLEQQPGVLACGVLPVQPWLDIPELGSAILVSTDNDPHSAAEDCSRLANEFWRRRHEYTPELFSIPEAVRLAFEQHTRGLVVFSGPCW